MPHSWSGPAIWIAQDMLFYTECCCYLLQLIFGIYFIEKLRNTSLTHINLRIVLGNTVLAFTLMGIGRMGVFVNYFLLANKPQLVTNLMCLGIKLIHETGLIPAAGAICLLAIERLYATIWRRTYEQRSSVIGWRIVGGVYLFSFSASLGGIIYDISTNTFNLLKGTNSCEINHNHRFVFPSLWLVGVFCYFSAIGLLAYLYKYNKCMKETNRGASLATRYQCAENVATIRALIPGICVYFVIGMLVLMTFPVLTDAWATDNYDMEQLVVQLFYLYPCINSLLGPLMFMLRFAPLNNALRNDVNTVFGLQLSIQDLSPHRPRHTDEEAAIYFRQLQQAWSK